MLLTLVVTIVIGLVVAVALIAVRPDLTAAQEDLRRGAAALRAAEPDAATAAFRRAEERSAAAAIRLSAIPVRSVGVLPIVGPQIRAASALAESAEYTAEAGSEMAAGLAALDGDIDAIARSRGGVPVGPLREIQPRLARASDLLTDAVSVAGDAGHSLLLSPLAQARSNVLTELEPVARTVTAGAALTAALPAFLGADGERRYLFGASTPAELRGTGGLIGAYAIMTVDDGRVTFDDFVPASQLPRAVDDPPSPPTEDYASRYGEFAAGGHWSNINMTPDFPTAATAIERLYEQEVGDAVDGTIVADPFALRLLLEATGPVNAPDIGTLRAADAVDVLTHDSYVELPDPGERKAVLGSAAVTVVDAFLHSDAEPERKLRLLADAVSQGHVLLHAGDADVQDAFLATEVAGQLVEPDGDFLAVVGNNAAANKLDWFAERAVDYEVELRSDGTARGHLGVELTNAAPEDGLPAYVIGPHDERFAAGENVTALAVYCPIDCRVERVRRDGRPEGVGPQAELDRIVLPTTVRVPAGDTRTLEYEWQRASGWESQPEGGVYRLAVQGQPTVRPTELSLRVRVPEGMVITAAPEDATVDDGEVAWQGTEADLRRFEIAFAPEPSGWQRALTSLGS